MIRATQLGFLISIAFAFTACGGSQVGGSSDDEPAWMNKSGELCAVGNQKVRSTWGNAQRFAVEKARKSLQAKLETKVGGMVDNYLKEGSTGAGDFSEEQSQEVIRNLTKGTLRGTNVAGKHKVKDGDIRELFVYVCIEPNGLTKALNDMKELGKAAKAALNTRAEKAQTELKDELKNYDRR